jgi:hypothetical protein
MSWLELWAMLQILVPVVLIGAVIIFYIVILLWLAYKERKKEVNR